MQVEEKEEEEEEERHQEEGKEDFQQGTEWEENYDLHSSLTHSLFVKHLQEIKLCLNVIYKSCII